MTRILLTFFVLFSTILLFAQTNPKVVFKTQFRFEPIPFSMIRKVPIEKPKIAFVLSGGGARGTAQIGVIKALFEHKIYPDLIIGTSFGSIVGGLLASGYSIEQLDSLVRNTEWESIVSLTARTKRTSLYVDQKITEDRSILTLQLKGLNPVIPTAVSSGQSFTNFLNQLIINAPIHHRKSFNELLYPLRIVCTDLISGKPVIIQDGDLGEAMRASSSVSFLLSPIPRDSFLLADGGLVANIPVRIARELGADIIIAINTTSPLRTAEELKLPWYLADQVVSIPLKKIEQMDLQEADFVISPELNHSATDFTGLDSLINNGYDAAITIAPIIKKFIRTKFLENLSSYVLENEEFISTEVERLNELIKSEECDSKFDSKIFFEELYALCESELEDIQVLRLDENDSPVYKIDFIKKPIIKNVKIYNIPKRFEEIVNSTFNDLIDKRFQPELIVDKCLSVLRSFRHANFSLISIEKINFDSLSNTLEINFTLGKIDSLIILGNSKTSLAIIEREILVEKDEVFDINKLQASLINLEATNLFENVFAYYRNENDKEYLYFKFKEKNTSFIRFGVRSDNERNVQLAIDLRDESFRGSGTEMAFQFFGGLRNRYLGFEHRANRIFKTYLNYKFRVYFSHVNHNYYTDSPENTETFWKRIKIGSYDIFRTGISLSFGTQVEKLGIIFFEGKFEKINFEPKFIPIFLKESFTVPSIKISSIFDSRDKYQYPNTGILMNLFFETALKLLWSNVSYSRIYFHYENNTTYSKRHSISPRLIFGYGDETVPFYEQFKLGGQRTFFGLREDDYLGRQIIISSLEYRYFLPIQILFDTYLRLRYDLGGIWASASTIKINELRHGVGLTISFDTPIGPADFSIGRSFYLRNDLLKKPLSFGPYQFYFEIGYPLL